MSLKNFVTLGRSGLRVSPLCLGAMTFGDDWGWGADVKESEAMMSAYLDRGGNFIDTANIYTNGHSEKIIGDFFKARKGQRDRAVIGTKFYCNLFDGDPNGGGAGRKAMVAQCEESLRRLQTDYIDLYWLHNWDISAPIDETMRALDDLVRAGKIRYVAFSDIPAWRTAEAQTIAAFRGWSPIIALQLEYSLLERTSEGELFPMAQSMGMGIMPWSPLKRGHLTGKYRRSDSANGPSAIIGRPSEKDFDIIEQLLEVSEEIGKPAAAVALAWVLKQPGVASPIIGARNTEQMLQNLEALEVSLSDAHIQRLNEVSKPQLNFPYAVNHYMAPALGFPNTTIDGKKIGPSHFLTNPVRY